MLRARRRGEGGDSRHRDRSIWTHGGIDKLEVWRELGAREVWIWQDGSLRFHLLRGEHYVVSRRSALLPKLDPAVLQSFMSGGTQPEAVQALRRALRKKPRRPRGA